MVIDGYEVEIEQDEDGWLVARVPALRGCHTQARSIGDLTERVREAIAVCRETDAPHPAT